MRFKIFGTDIYISFLFAAVIAFLLATDRTGLVIPTLFACLIHETGHLFAMWIRECQPKSIRLVPATVQITRDFACKPNSQGIIAVCGPAANIAVFLSLLINYFIFKKESILVFALLNLIIAVFNLLPVSGLDGGTLLELLIARYTDANRAYSAVKIITALFAAAAFVVGFLMWFSGNFNLSVFIIAVYLVLSCLVKQ